jgi:hypothetical protein
VSEFRRVIRWADPPPSVQGNHQQRGPRPSTSWMPIIADLELRPGTWALVAEQVTRAEATNARNCLMRRHPIEATMRGPVPGPFDVYARWTEDTA